jgi:hypothetical protein
MDTADMTRAEKLYRDLVGIAADYANIPREAIEVRYHDGWSTYEQPKPHYDRPSDSITISFTFGVGWECVEHDWDKGYDEYATVAYLLRGKVYKGIDAVIVTAAHECAHMLADWRYICNNLDYVKDYVNKYNRWPKFSDKPHGRSFQSVYKELLSIFLD